MQTAGSLAHGLAEPGKLGDSAQRGAQDLVLGDVDVVVVVGDLDGDGQAEPVAHLVAGADAAAHGEGRFFTVAVSLQDPGCQGPFGVPAQHRGDRADEVVLVDGREVLLAPSRVVGVAEQIQQASDRHFRGHAQLQALDRHDADEAAGGELVAVPDRAHRNRAAGLQRECLRGAHVGQLHPLVLAKGELPWRRADAQRCSSSRAAMAWRSPAKPNSPSMSRPEPANCSSSSGMIA